MQASYSHLPDRFFADNETVFETAKLYAASVIDRGNLFVGNGSSKDCSDVRTQHKRESEYDVRQPHCFYGRKGCWYDQGKGLISV